MVHYRELEKWDEGMNVDSKAYYYNKIEKIGYGHGCHVLNPHSLEYFDDFVFFLSNSMIFNCFHPNIPNPKIHDLQKFVHFQNESQFFIRVYFEMPVMYNRRTQKNKNSCCCKEDGNVQIEHSRTTKVLFEVKLYNAFCQLSR